MAKEFFAPGIPEHNLKRELPTIEKSTPWALSVSHHDAVRSGPHIDLRLVSQEGIAYSFAGRYMPSKSGEQRLFHRTDDHSAEYALTVGKDKPYIISSGYGKGVVNMKRLAPIEVITSNPNKISFTIYDKQRPQLMTIRRWKGDDFLLLDHTPTEKTFPIIERKKYKSIDIEKIDISNPDLSLSPKYDGASSLLYLAPNKRPRIISTRTPKRGGVIEHTQRFPELLDFIIPESVGPVVLAGEILALDKKGRFAGANITAGILNSNVLLAREKTKEIGALENFIFDIVRGLKADAPYEEKLDFIRYVSSIVPKMRPAEVAVTQKDKADLIKRIVSGKHPHTKEGLVSSVRRDSGIKLIKHKITPETDVYIRDIVTGTGRLRDSAGAVYYSHTPRGPIAGKVGTGFSDRSRDLIWKRKEDLIGAVISLKSMGEYPKTGALRAPVFLRIHPDKNPTVDPDLMEQLA